MIKASIALNSYGGLNIAEDGWVYYYSRPAVVLRSDVISTIDTESTYAPGTQLNPYLID